VAVGPGRFDQAEDPAAGFGTGHGVGEQKVFARDGDRLGDVLGLDVGDRQAPVGAVVL